MINSKKHKIIINKKRMEVISADTDFYGFLDDTRVYYSFDQLILAEDRQRFLENIEQNCNNWFVVHILDLTGKPVPCYAKLIEGSSSDNVEIVLLDIEMLRKSEWALKKQSLVNEAIQGLYGDDMFLYYPDKDEVEIITGAGAHMTSTTMSLEQLQKNLEQLTKEKDTVNEFISGLRSGSRYLFIKVDGNVRNVNSESSHSIIKCAGLYENGTYYMSVGYVHEYMERTYKDTRKIEIDSLTGLLTKAEITNMVTRMIDLEKRQNVTLAIIDIDHFKRVNDDFGHMTGDNVLRQVGAILAEEMGDTGLVGRIGGDEFMILFYDAFDLEEDRPRLRSIKNRVCGMYPPNVPGQPAVTLSIGCAAYPKDASNYEELFTLADFALYRAKEKGRNRYIIYNRNTHGDLSEIKNTVPTKTRINNRGDMSRSDILCVIMDKVSCKEDYPLENLLDDYLENFEISRITVYDRDAGKVLYMVGQMVPSNKVIEETQEYILSDYWQNNYNDNATVINDIVAVAPIDNAVYQMMKKQGVMACIQVPFKDKKNHRCVISFETVEEKYNWNTEILHQYRLMAKVLSEYTLVQ